MVCRVVGWLRRRRTVTGVAPAKAGMLDGLAYALWLPEDRVPRPDAGVVTVHGAGSCKENHYGFARAVAAAGMAVLAFDQRGHGESDGPLDARAIDDVVAMASLLRAELGDPAAPVALRGSSMGGYLALATADRAGAAAVVAICPASAGGLRRGLREGAFDFDADAEALDELLAAGDLHPIVDALTVPVLLLHAQGDERVPVQHSRELAALLKAPASRLIEVPGGHHRSIQQDEDLQSVSVRFIEQALRRRPA
jgi:pimeloyl-ACP methyl ester carboxylesterase